jgi:hypothetical protein
MTDTPRTNALLKGDSSAYSVDVAELLGLSRQLEREIAQLQRWATINGSAERERELAEANKILEDTLRALPVGYIPAHTFESIAARVRDIVEKLAESSQREESLEQYADELAAGLPVGMLPKDVENLRHANGIFAQQVFELEQQMTEAWHILSVLSSNLLDDGPTWPRALEWLDKNIKFRPVNNLI